MFKGKTLLITREFTSFMLILILTVVSNDTFLFGSNCNESMTALPRYGLLAFAIFFGLKLIAKKRVASHTFAMAGLMALLLAVSCLHNYISTNLFVVKIVILSSGFLFCQHYDFEIWSQYFRKVIFFLSICSIIMTLLAYIAPSLILALPTATNIAGVKMYLGFFSGILDDAMNNTTFIRCPGVFWEPGVYQIYLNIAILLTLYSTEKNKSKPIIVYVIALLFTFSTTGFIAVAWIFATYVMFSKNTKRSTTKTIIYFLLLSFVFLAGLLLSDSELFDFVFGKLNSTHGSYTARLAGFVINYEIARDNPIFGFGADMIKISDEFIKRSSASTIVFGTTRHNTNTLMYQFAAFGIPFGLLYLYGTFNFGRQLASNKMTILSIFGTFVILYTGENLFSSIFPYIIVFYGMNAIGHSQERVKRNKLVRAVEGIQQ